MSSVVRPQPLTLTSDDELPGVQHVSEVAKWARLYLYGRSGAGKTRLAGTADDDARSRPVLFLDVEDGLLTIAKRKNVDRRIIDSVKPTLESTYLWLVNHPGRYRTVVIDSLTALQKTLEADIKRDSGRQQLTLQDWGTVQTRLYGIVKQFCSLPAHIIITALERETKDERTGEVSVGPALAGNVGTDIAAIPNTVARLFVDDVLVVKPDGSSVSKSVRRLLLQSRSKYFAKDRSDGDGGLPPILDDPTFSGLLDRMVQAGAELE